MQPVSAQDLQMTTSLVICVVLVSVQAQTDQQAQTSNFEGNQA